MISSYLTSLDVVLNKPNKGGSNLRLSFIRPSISNLSFIKSDHKLSMLNNLQTRLEINEVVVSFPATNI